MNSFLTKITLYLSGVICLFACCDPGIEGNSNANDKFELIKSTSSNIDFSNVVKDEESLNIINYRNFYNGGGVAIGDINNDGLKDIYFTANQNSNKLYLNKGDMTFEDLTEKARVGGSKFWSTGVSMVDVNADGFLDIYVCNSVSEDSKKRENELYINNGDLTFSERAQEYGLNDSGNSVHAAFFDFDKDGDLDCFVLNNSYSDPQKIARTASGDRFNYGSPGGDRIYLNESGVFIDYTEKSGIFSGDTGFGLGVSIGDLNNDTYPDIYISNDFWERDYLYINQKDGKFKEELTDRLDYVSANSMGSDIADINNDGLLDLYSTDMLPATNRRMKSAVKFEEFFLEEKKWKDSYYFQFIMNCLHVNGGNGQFKETGFYSGVAATDWSWGSLIFDMDNDGLKDIFVSNGIYNDITDLDFIDFASDEASIRAIIEEKGKFDIDDFVERLPNNKQVNFAFVNEGELRFSNKASSLGLRTPSFSNGSAFGDLDNDGDYDLVVNNLNMEAFLYRNNAEKDSTSHFLRINLKGSKGNVEGLGTRVDLYSGDAVQTMVAQRSRGFQSSSDSDIIFGMKEGLKIDSLLVLWPTGEKEVKLGRDVEYDSELTFHFEGASANDRKEEQNDLRFEEVGSLVFEEAVKHEENPFNDYDQEPLTPHALSTEGPKIIKGDVNGDKKEDFLVLGAAGFLDRLFISKRGTYLESTQTVFEEDVDGESTAAAFFDSDNDGDLDLIIGVGGNDLSKSFDSYKTRFFLNDGRGNFSKAPNTVAVTGQVSCIRPCDFDHDGDLDLFIGVHSIPGNYGLTPKSFLLRNQGDNEYEDISNEFTGPIGMVKDATWIDVDGDQKEDLIVAGEWMPITILLQKNSNITAGYTIANSNGWWNSITPADLDGDGSMDFVLGNWGENMKFSASKEKPLNLYVSDFDNNGKVEQVIEWHFGEDQEKYPFASKSDLTNQIPKLKKQSLRYAEYAEKQVKDLFSADALDQASKKFADNFSTSILINKNNKLELKRIANHEAQLSPVFASHVSDLDSDGIMDILLGGNFYFLKPEIGRHDGFDGGYFKGKADGTYEYVDFAQSGLRIEGEVRDIQKVNEHILVARNKDELLVFKSIQSDNL